MIRPLCAAMFPNHRDVFTSVPHAGSVLRGAGSPTLSALVSKTQWAISQTSPSKRSWCKVPGTVLRIWTNDSVKEICQHFNSVVSSDSDMKARDKRPGSSLQQGQESVVMNDTGFARWGKSSWMYSPPQLQRVSTLTCPTAPLLKLRDVPPSDPLLILSKNTSSVW